MKPAPEAAALVANAKEQYPSSLLVPESAVCFAKDLPKILEKWPDLMHSSNSRVLAALVAYYQDQRYFYVIEQENADGSKARRQLHYGLELLDKVSDVYPRNYRALYAFLHCGIGYFKNRTVDLLTYLSTLTDKSLLNTVLELIESFVYTDRFFNISVQLWQLLISNKETTIVVNKVIKNPLLEQITVYLNLLTIWYDRQSTIKPQHFSTVQLLLEAIIKSFKDSAVFFVGCNLELLVKTFMDNLDQCTEEIAPELTQLFKAQDLGLVGNFFALFFQLQDIEFKKALLRLASTSGYDLPHFFIEKTQRKEGVPLSEYSITNRVAILTQYDASALLNTMLLIDCIGLSERYDDFMKLLFPLPKPEGYDEKLKQYVAALSDILAEFRTCTPEVIKRQCDFLFAITQKFGIERAKNEITLAMKYTVTSLFQNDFLSGIAVNGIAGLDDFVEKMRDLDSLLRFKATPIPKTVDYQRLYSSGFVNAALFIRVLDRLWGNHLNTLNHYSHSQNSYIFALFLAVHIKHGCENVDELERVLERIETNRGECEKDVRARLMVTLAAYVHINGFTGLLAFFERNCHVFGIEALKNANDQKKDVELNVVGAAANASSRGLFAITNGSQSSQQQSRNERIISVENAQNAPALKRISAEHYKKLCTELLPRYKGEVTAEYAEVHSNRLGSINFNFKLEVKDDFESLKLAKLYFLIQLKKLLDTDDALDLNAIITAAKSETKKKYPTYDVEEGVSSRIAQFIKEILLGNPMTLSLSNKGVKI